MKRLGEIPEYRRMFEEAYPGTRFERHDVRARVERDRRLSHRQAHVRRTRRGIASSRDNDNALTPRQLAGAQTFLTLKCSLCHNGSTFSDEKFHDVAVAQIGPGEGNGATLRDDFGRMSVTGIESDQLSLPHDAAPQRGAHGPVRPRWRDRHAAGFRRALQRIGSEAPGVRSDAARARAAGHAAAEFAATSSRSATRCSRASCSRRCSWTSSWTT